MHAHVAIASSLDAYVAKHKGHPHPCVDDVKVQFSTSKPTEWDDPVAMRPYFDFLMKLSRVPLESIAQDCCEPNNYTGRTRKGVLLAYDGHSCEVLTPFGEIVVRARTREQCSTFLEALRTLCPDFEKRKLGCDDVFLFSNFHNETTVCVVEVCRLSAGMTKPRKANNNLQFFDLGVCTQSDGVVFTQAASSFSERDMFDRLCEEATAEKKKELGVSTVDEYVEKFRGLPHWFIENHYAWLKAERPIDWDNQSRMQVHYDILSKIFRRRIPEDFCYLFPHNGRTRNGILLVISDDNRCELLTPFGCMLLCSAGYANFEMEMRDLDVLFPDFKSREANLNDVFFFEQIFGNGEFRVRESKRATSNSWKTRFEACELKIYNLGCSVPLSDGIVFSGMDPPLERRVALRQYYEGKK